MQKILLTLQVFLGLAAFGLFLGFQYSNSQDGLERERVRVVKQAQQGLDSVLDCLKSACAGQVAASEDRIASCTRAALAGLQEYGSAAELDDESKTTLSGPQIDGPGKRSFELPHFKFGILTLTERAFTNDALKEATGAECSTWQFSGDELVRISTTIKIDEKGARANGAWLSSEDPRTTSLKSGKSLLHREDRNGIPHLVHYTPLLDDSAQVLGAISVALDESKGRKALASFSEVRIGSSGFAFCFERDRQFRRSP